MNKQFKKIQAIKEFCKLLPEKSFDELVEIRDKYIRNPLVVSENEWFALVQEMSFRILGLRHFDTQLLAGLVMAEGKIVEMKTGEGKTLSSTLSLSYKALQKKGTHLITVNEYLAERDQKTMGKLYASLGLTSSLVSSKNSVIQKRENYLADITYVTNTEIVFDYLRDCTSYTPTNLVLRPFFYALVDEIDSILIDEARTPFILSESTSEGNKEVLIKSKLIASNLKKDEDFLISKKTQEISFTELGYLKCQKLLNKENLFDSSEPWALSILNALSAFYTYQINKDYIILNNKIVIVDKSTGRTMEGRRWSMGIHEAIEVKENVEIGESTQTKISITYPSFFSLYPDFSGMTGTALTVQNELKSTYKKDIFAVPTFNPTIRKDLPDVVYVNEQEKWLAVVNYIKTTFKTGQPILIGTTSIQKSEFLSDALKKEQIPHNVLNAKPKNIRLESEIIAQAGKKYSITIATNMAGRGTDILLGGNLEFQVQKKIFDILKFSLQNSSYFEFVNSLKKEYADNLNKLILDIKNLPHSYTSSKSSLQKFYRHIYAELYPNWKAENQEVKNLGGLIVLGTERHESRRIDDQLRGRAGRQGDPGSSQFYLSLNDELFQKYAGSNIAKIIDSLDLESDVPLGSPLLTRTIEKVQQKVENFYFEGRKNLLEYEKPINMQRDIFFDARYKLITQFNWLQEFLREKEKSFRLLSKWQKKSNPFYPINLKGLNYLKPKALHNTKQYFLGTFFQPYAYHYKKISQMWVDNDLQNAILVAYGSTILPEEILENVDNLWSLHSEQMQYDRENIQFKVYSQQTPTAQYIISSFEAFKKLNSKILESIFSYFQPLTDFEEFAMYGGILYKQDKRYASLWTTFETIEKTKDANVDEKMIPSIYKGINSNSLDDISSEELLNCLFI